MAVTVTATLVDDATGWTTKGDPHWVPDITYYRRFLLDCSGPEVVAAGHIVNWEVFDATAVPFVANAALTTVQATGGTYTGANAPAYLNNRNTNTVWVRNAKAQDLGVPYYTETGQPWVSSYRANGNRVQIELPVTLAWGTTGAKTQNFEIVAYLPGGGRVPAGTVSKTVSNPDVANLK